MKGRYASNDGRPDPEELLDRHGLRDPLPEDSGEIAAVAAKRRGRLRILIGMAAGVGKTFAMLREGHELETDGKQVIAGLVETHGRELTRQQIGDLPVVPRRSLPHAGKRFEEMDLDAILAWEPRPNVVLVDELAHTNVPGSRNEKRYQDVEEILTRGISVITTLNVQHIESLADIVKHITDQQQRETVPDSVLENADEIRIIDITPQELRERMRNGQVYPEVVAARALNHYFRVGNLINLRELLLLRMARLTDKTLDSLMHREMPANDPVWHRALNETVLVAFDGRPHSRAILRAAGQLTGMMKAGFEAVTVECPRHHDSPPEDLEGMIRYAIDLGANVTRLTGCDVAAILADALREKKATQFVIGQPSRSHWQEFWRRSVTNQLVRMPLSVAIHIVPIEREVPAD